MIKNFILWGISIIMLASQGCSKDSFQPQQNTPTQINKSAPIVWLHKNLSKFPFNKISLTGGVYDVEGNIMSYHWTKVRGAESCTIEHNDSSSTIISNLVNGDYEFQLEVKDSLGLSDKETISVNVDLKAASSNEYIFKDLIWTFPWHTQLEIPNIFYIAEIGRPYKVYIQRYNKPEWVKVSSSWNENDFYHYVVDGWPREPRTSIFGVLTLYYFGIDASDTPTVKIVFP